MTDTDFLFSSYVVGLVFGAVLYLGFSAIARFRSGRG
jgi:hypothetical protein